MHLSAEAWRLREEARASIAMGDFGRGFELATEADGVQRTEAGKALLQVCQWLTYKVEAPILINSCLPAILGFIVFLGA